MATLLYLLLIVAILLAVKRYFRGGVCSVRRNLQGRVAVVTGGNTGIGKETVAQLLAADCNVVFGARDRAKSEEALKAFAKVPSKGWVKYLSLDLGDKSSIENFVREISTTTDKVDLLINNAGVMYLPKLTLTKDGFQSQVGINHLGHFYLTFLLWPLLKKSNDLRIINVSSLAHIITPNVKFEPDNFNWQKGYRPKAAYGRSKLFNILFTKQLARRLQKVKPDALAVSLHPGVVRTQLMRYYLTGIWQHIFKIVIEPIYWIFSKDSFEGSQTTMYTALEDKSRLVNGAYYSDCALKGSSALSQDMNIAAQLWALSEQKLKIKFDLN